MTELAVQQIEKVQYQRGDVVWVYEHNNETVRYGIVLGWWKGQDSVHRNPYYEVLVGMERLGCYIGSRSTKAYYDLRVAPECRVYQ
jgi:hypothetical protein